MTLGTPGVLGPGCKKEWESLRNHLVLQDLLLVPVSNTETGFTGEKALLAQLGRALPPLPGTQGISPGSPDPGGQEHISHSRDLENIYFFKRLRGTLQESKANN